MDLFGYVLRFGGEMQFGDHIEWWAGRQQYSSMTTLLYWAPNHSVLIWLATALLIRYGNCVNFITKFQLVIALLSIVSPFGVIGLTAIYLAYLLPNIKKVITIEFFISLCVSFIVTLYVFLFLHDDSRSFMFGRPNIYSWYVELSRYIIFVLLEVLLYGVVVIRSKTSENVFWFALVYLLLVPLIPSIGPANDFAMRSTVAPLFVIMICCYKVLISDIVIKKYKIILFSLLCVGSVTPASEIYRGFTFSANSIIDLKKNLYDITNAEAHHYYARCSESSLIKCPK
jgi:hypothetical protein